jgi:hypothetical protein
VEVDDDRLRRELIDELDRLQAVLCDADDGQPRLLIDQRSYGFHERPVVVDEDDVDRTRRDLSAVRARGATLAHELQN